MCNISKQHQQQQKKRLNIEDIKDLTQCLMSIGSRVVPGVLILFVYYYIVVLFISFEYKSCWGFLYVS